MRETQSHTVVGRLDIVPLTSRIFHNKHSLRVWLSPGYDPSQKYPVLYILDGASAFDVCASYNHEEMQADETLTELITTGKIPPLIAVGIDNGSDAIRQGDCGEWVNRGICEEPSSLATRSPHSRVERLWVGSPKFRGQGRTVGWRVRRFSIWMRS